MAPVKIKMLSCLISGCRGTSWKNSTVDKKLPIKKGRCCGVTSVKPQIYVAITTTLAPRTTTSLPSTTTLPPSTATAAGPSSSLMPAPQVAAPTLRRSTRTVRAPAQLDMDPSRSTYR
ncbi:hypothetical protein B9Z55_005524 [Caenorhabditis nigoni]|uniref:Uncharacterized protein n=1 Tax=Caenorhabditis nigoni TaxID=1611254 RepID=A0A2G5V168_9PELO|nr:hypothetical protein B9Z55_005524 [Caenorhabditis nigoni]